MVHRSENKQRAFHFDSVLKQRAVHVSHVRELVAFHWFSIFALGPRHTAHVIKLRVRSHVGEVREPIGHGEEGGYGGDVPGALAVKAVLLQGLEMLLCDGVAATHRHRKVQHGALSRQQVCVFIVNHDLGATRRRSHGLEFTSSPK